MRLFKAHLIHRESSRIWQDLVDQLVLLDKVSPRSLGDDLESIDDVEDDE